MFLLETGVIHQTHYGRQPATLPSLPGILGTLDTSAPRFNYIEALRTHDYNKEVALYLSQQFIARLPAVGGHYAGFVVTDIMRNVEAVMDLIFVRADETKKHFRNAGPAMEHVRKDKDDNNRHYSRRRTVCSIFLT
jgi:hypothetical protein